MQIRYVRQLIAAFVLRGFALLGTALVALIYGSTRERISENQRQALLRQRNLLIPSDYPDNDPLSDVITIQAPETLNTGVTRVHRAHIDGQPVAALFKHLSTRSMHFGVMGCSEIVTIFATICASDFP